jgi:hypothetical protein
MSSYDSTKSSTSNKENPKMLKWSLKIENLQKTAMHEVYLTPESSSIKFQESGIYYLEYMCFIKSKKIPGFQLLLNDDPVLSTISEKSSLNFIFHGSNQKQLTFGVYLQIKDSQKLSLALIKNSDGILDQDQLPAGILNIHKII